MTDALTLDDDDDWIDLEKPVPASAQRLRGVTLKLSQWSRGGQVISARTTLTFRSDSAEWLREHGPRFRVRIGGPNVDMIRIVPDNATGRFEYADMKSGTARISLGTVNVWPNETREAVDCEWKVHPGFMELRLPKDFAKPTPVQMPPMGRPRNETPASVAALRAPGSGKPQLSAQARVIDHRVSGTVSMGEPPPGRSALDQRRAAQKAREE